MRTRWQSVGGTELKVGIAYDRATKRHTCKIEMAKP